MRAAGAEYPHDVIRGSHGLRASVSANLLRSQEVALPPPETASRAFFDWYAATLPDTPSNVVISALRERFPSAVHTPFERGLRGYRSRLRIDDPEGVRICEVLSDGNDGTVHVSASGVYSPEVAELLRHRWEHWVTRADGAIDFIRPGIFDELDAKLTHFARQHDLVIDQRGDWERGRGRTRYIGSRKSGVFIRLYEKGDQVGGDPNWVRLEVEVKPSNKPGKYRLAGKEPHELFHACRWVSKVSMELLLPEAMQFSVGTVRTVSDSVHRRLAMIEQYARTITEWIEAAGSVRQFLAELRGYIAAVIAAPSGERHAQVQELRARGLIDADQGAGRRL